MRPAPAAVLVLLAAAPLLAQTATQTAPQKPSTPGILTGHVFCADTQRPARIAQVRLLRVPVPADLKENKSGEPELPTNLSEVVETSLDGSFTVPNVKPGRYYLVVEKEGYIDPVALFTPKQLASPDDSTRQRLEATLHPVDIPAGQTVNQEISLQRGASIAGTATYDDGTPAAELQVNLLAKGPDGKWDDGFLRRYGGGFSFMRTDDYGRFRAAGLPPGDYLIKVDLALSEHTTSQFPDPSNPSRQVTMFGTNTKFELPLYTGNVWREKLAIPVTIAGAEDKTGIDLQFPLDKLHPVSGRVLARDGHAVNGGNVAVLYPDDKKQVISTPVSFAEADFKMDFVPEGEYTLAVTAPKDVQHLQVANPKGYTPSTHEEPKTIKTYPDAEQPLLVKGDTLNVIVNLPDKKSDAAASATIQTTIQNQP